MRIDASPSSATKNNPMARAFFFDDRLQRDLLEAIGEVTVAEAQVEAILINALKRAFRISVTEAQSRARNEWLTFKKQRKALLNKYRSDYPDDDVGHEELKALLNEAAEARERRHAQVHAVALVDADTGQRLRLHQATHIGHDVADLNGIRDDMVKVRNRIEVFTRNRYLNAIGK